MLRQHLNDIKKELQFDIKDGLIELQVKFKLDRSLDNYMKDVEKHINYILSRDNNKVKKYTDKMGRS